MKESTAVFLPPNLDKEHSCLPGWGQFTLRETLLVKGEVLFAANFGALVGTQVPPGC